jgi:hypothetical protein
VKKTCDEEKTQNPVEHRKMKKRKQNKRKAAKIPLEKKKHTDRGH